MQGSYKGTEIWGSTASGGSQAGGSSSYTITVDALGKVTASYSSHSNKTISDYDETSGMFNLEGYVGVYNATDKVAVINYGSGGDVLKNDMVIYVQGLNNHASTGCYWDAGLTRLVQFTGNDDNPYIVFVYNNYVYGGVTFEAEKADGSAITDIKQVYSAASVVVKKGDTVIAEFAKGTSGLIALDGYQGTYTGSANGVTNIVVDGIGNVTVNEEASKVKYAVADGTFTQVQDGFAGTYALPDGAGNITLDGIGGAGDGKTYVVSGTTVTVYDGDSSTNYGIDVENKVFLGKSIFAGLTFEGNSLQFVFEDGVEIGGTLSTTTYPQYEYGFTAELDKATNTLTFTITSENYKMNFVGKTFTAAVSNGKLTFTSSFKPDNSVDLNGKEVTCADFTYAG